ncbi:Holliday junction resolvase, putative [Babesia ovis]|uniref:Holliday junction resolvase, putative n=1 Tax=Babesia ovis TaxID=5869 RepID=A0A9W5TF08_BABOV|nr:Holliday junction resolvase, putative [Babesia ovis]
MNLIRRHEIFVANDSSQTAILVEKCSTLLNKREVDEIVLKAPIKHATRAVAVYELLRRRYNDLVATSELRDIFNGESGKERRKLAMLEIRITQSKRLCEPGARHIEREVMK